MAGLICGLKPHGLAATLNIKIGDELLGVDGQPVQDIIELSYLTATEDCVLNLQRQGKKVDVKVHKHPDEDLGLEFESAVFDKVRLCHNHCIFCFVDQMIPGMRKGLYVRDDDYRLSFLYGNFVTLTNVTEADFQRIIATHMTPLYVSIHATDAKVRCDMMRNPKAGDILEKLQRLIEAGIEVHTQIVCCPEHNDGKVLAKTYHDLVKLAPGVASMAIVPVGLTKHREELYALRTFTKDEAKKMCSTVSRWQKECQKNFGKSFVYLADEFYLLAEMKIPPVESYDAFPQLENGIGLTRVFLADWEEHCNDGRVDKHEDAVIPVGEAAAKVLQPYLDKFNKKHGTKHQIVAVKNNFFGGAVNVTGLLSGGDILRGICGINPQIGRIILPAVVLNKDNLFLDDMSLAEFKAQCGGVVEIAATANELLKKL